MKKVNIFILIVIVFSIFGCKTNSDQVFQKMIDSAAKNKEKVYLSFFDANRKSGNKYYDFLVNSKDINLDFFYKQTQTIQETNFAFELINCELTTGDLALSILWDRDKFGDKEIKELFPIDVYENFENSGSSILYKWIQNDLNHRTYIANKTLEIILKKEGVNSEVNLDEVRENFSRKYLNSGNYLITCNFLRYEPTVTGVAWPKYYLWISVFDPDTYELVFDGAIRIALLGYENLEIDITDFIQLDGNKKNIEEFYKVFPTEVCERIKYRKSIGE